jgi:DNA modification methylase
VLDDVQKLMGEEKADMVWTDPPYNVAYEGKTKDALKIQNDEMSAESFYQFIYDAYSNMLMFTKPGGAIYVAHADSEGMNFRKALVDSGWLLKQCLIWVKQALVMGRQDYHWKHEPILYGWAPGASHNWYSDRKQTTVLEFDRPSRNAEHPTMMPIELIEYCLTNSCAAKGLVLDLFGGSGSTLIACEKTGRKAALVELDPRYCDVIVARWEKYTGKKASLLNAGSDPAAINSGGKDG